MSGAKKSSLTSLETWIKIVTSRKFKICSGNKDPGERVAPTKSGNNDSKDLKQA
ncbi:hypothetical protein GX50_01760 [[Emmonsia] crescens]|uniref:Uncharacterized protein n=1 Tax=[Emmonsia] crescens TaxID=73230 RepID=A0A2B7ZR01_9EURO|nr:hypothetical protein GX50_01760 [Emmonsia crescens]